MKPTTKKLIAREFLILLSTAILSIIIYYGFHIKNDYDETELLKVINEIDSKNKNQDSLFEVRHSKLIEQKWFFDSFSKEYDMSDANINTPAKWWNKFENYVKTDSLEFKYLMYMQDQKLFLTDLGITNLNDFKSFIIKNTITKEDSLKFDKIAILQTEIDSLNQLKNNLQTKIQIFESNNGISFRLIICLFTFGIAFALRYLIYAIIWSIKTVRTKE